VQLGGGRDFDPVRFDELILYIALRSEGSEWFGRTKLIKLLWFSDFEAFRRLGKSITGATYRKLNYGPAPQQFHAAVDRLTKSRAAAERKVQVFRYEQNQLVALREADVSIFSGSEIAIVDEMLARFHSTTASQISELTHRHPGWRLAKMNEPIPYETVILPERQRELSEDEMAWARAALDKLEDEDEAPSPRATVDELDDE
jgi:hypothetical protein